MSNSNWHKDATGAVPGWSDPIESGPISLLYTSDAKAVFIDCSDDERGSESFVMDRFPAGHYWRETGDLEWVKMPIDVWCSLYQRYVANGWDAQFMEVE